MNFLQLLLQPSRVDDGHRGAWGEGEELAGWSVLGARVGGKGYGVSRRRAGTADP